MKNHLKHLAMCAPMIVVAGILLATGSSWSVVVLLLACTVMMWAMMAGMSGRSDR
jgi:hypothetical protein